MIGPAGAVVNGVELLSEDLGAVDEEVLELIRHSTTETTRRLTYFRLALGVPAEGQTLATCRTIADGYFESSKVGIDWSDAIMATTPPPPSCLIPILLNLLLCGAESLPRGGRIAIEGTASGDRYLLHIKASGETIKVDIHDIRRVELAAYADCQAFTAVLIQNVHRPEDLSVVGSVVDKIIRPDVVAVLWS